MDDQNLLLLASKFRKLRDKVETLSVKQDEIQTIKGDQGPKGEQGDRGFDGAPGKDGDDGADGTDGQDGKDGVSVVNAEISFDGSLVIYLSDGREIDCGYVVKETGDTVIQTLKQGAAVSGGGGITSITSTDGSVVITTVGGVVDLAINVFNSTTKGLVPASGGGTTNFLRADGTFAAPPATAPAGSNTQIQYNNAGAFGAIAGFSYNTSTSTFNIAPASTNVIIEPVAPTGAQTSTSISLRTKNASATNGAGGNIFVSTGSGLGTGASGRISFTTAASSNVSGSISFVAGNGTNSGGAMTFAAGAGTGTNSNGGGIQIQSGIGNGTGSGGGLEITGGNCVGTGFGGGFAMFGGYASLGVGGDFQLIAGGGGAASGSLYIGTDSNPSCFTITEDGAAASQMGFFNAAPVTQPTAVPVTAAGIHAALVSLGLIT